MYKYLLHIPELDDQILNIINSTHSSDYTTKKGAIIKMKKNLSLMYPKYVYPIHLVLREIKYNNNSYGVSGCAISRNVVRKKIGEHSRVASLILDKLQEHNIIVKIKNYSNGSNRKSASRYKLKPEIEKLFHPDDAKHLKKFTREEHGKMIENLVKDDIKYKKQVIEYRKNQKEVHKMNKEIENVNMTKTKHITQEQADKYFAGMARQLPGLDGIGLQNAINNIITKDKRLNNEQAKMLHAMLPTYIQSVNVQVRVENQETPPVETNEQSIVDELIEKKSKIYRGRNLVSMVTSELLNLWLDNIISEATYHKMKKEVSERVHAQAA